MKTDKCEAVKNAGKNRKMTGNVDIEGDNRENVTLSAGNVDISGSNFSNLVVNAGNLDISSDNQGVITFWAGNIEVWWVNKTGSHICVVSWGVEVWSNQGVITVKTGTLKIGNLLSVSAGNRNSNTVVSYGNSSISVNGNNVSVSGSGTVCINGECVTMDDVREAKKKKNKKDGSGSIDPEFSINDELRFDLTASRLEYKGSRYLLEVGGDKKLGDYVFRKTPTNTVEVFYKGQKITYSQQEGARVEAIK